MDKVNAGQRKNSQVESESINNGVTKIEIAINPTIEKVESENKEVVSAQKLISILVAEDDEFYFAFIETLLFPLNYKIFHAKDGKEAVDIYRSNNDIRLILMDIQMPVMDGLTATKEIRKINPEVPVIAQTSIRINGAKKKAILSGCNDFFLKPVEPEVLIMKIEYYLKLTAKN